MHDYIKYENYSFHYVNCILSIFEPNNKQSVEVRPLVYLIQITYLQKWNISVKRLGLSYFQTNYMWWIMNITSIVEKYHCLAFNFSYFSNNVFLFEFALPCSQINMIKCIELIFDSFTLSFSVAKSHRSHVAVIHGIFFGAIM